MKHKCMFYWFNLEHYGVHGLRDGIRLMLDFGINHYHWKWFDVRLQSFLNSTAQFIASIVAQRVSAALYCYCAMLHYNHTVILFKRTQLMVTLKAFRNEYSGSQAIKLIMVNMAVSAPLIWLLQGYFLIVTFLIEIPSNLPINKGVFRVKTSMIGCSSDVNQNTIQTE